MLANRGPNRCQAPGATPGRMLANREPKSVPGTRCEARSNASKQGAQIGARHPVRSQVIVRQPGTVPEFLSHKPPLNQTTFL